MLARLIPSALFLLAVGACADHDAPTAASSAPAAAAHPAPTAAGTPSVSARADEAHLEALARRTALALRDPSFRAYVKTELDRSPFPEHKIQFQRFLRADGGRALNALAVAAGEAADAVAAEAAAAVALEIYLPVPAHRAAWTGDAKLLVATAIEDHEAPIAFDVDGRRQLLDADHPPATPVIAVVPVETDFDHVAGPARMQCANVEDCTSGGGGGTDTGSGSGTIDQSVSSTAAGLYLTYAQYVQDFEGWLKGSPEFEIHIMGPAQPGDTTSLASFQCVGEHASAPYAWDMNQLTWSGSQLLFSTAQMNAFSTAYPGRAFVIFAIEDDDTACGIRTDSDRGSALIKAISDAYANYKAAKDQDILTLTGIQKILRAAKSGSSLLSSAYSFLKSNDDIVGIAVSDSVIGRYKTQTNWTVLDKTLNTNAAFRLDIH
jgi:hypothetical protein